MRAACAASVVLSLLLGAAVGASDSARIVAVLGPSPKANADTRTMEHGALLLVSPEAEAWLAAARALEHRVIFRLWTVLISANAVADVGDDVVVEALRLARQAGFEGSRWRHAYALVHGRECATLPQTGNSGTACVGTVSGDARAVRAVERTSLILHGERDELAHETSALVEEQRRATALAHAAASREDAEPPPPHLRHPAIVLPGACLQHAACMPPQPGAIDVLASWLSLAAIYAPTPDQRRELAAPLEFHEAASRAPAALFTSLGDLRARGGWCALIQARAITSAGAGAEFNTTELSVPQHSWQGTTVRLEVVSAGDGLAGTAIQVLHDQETDGTARCRFVSRVGARQLGPRTCADAHAHALAAVLDTASRMHRAGTMHAEAAVLQAAIEENAAVAAPSLVREALLDGQGARPVLRVPVGLPESHAQPTPGVTTLQCTLPDPPLVAHWVLNRMAPPWAEEVLAAAA